MKSKDINEIKKRRIYQVAKEFHVSNEALIDFLRLHHFKAQNIMSPVSEVMYEAVCQQYIKTEVDEEKEPDYRKRILEKREEERVRREAIQHEIDEVLERSKGTTFEPVEIVERKKKKVIRRTQIVEKPKKIKEELVEEITDKNKEKEKKEKPWDKEKKETVAVEGETVEKESGVEKPKRHLIRHPKVEEREAKGERGREAVEEGAKDKRKRRKHKRADVGKYTKTDEAKVYIPARKKKKRKRKKAAVKIDEKEIEASIKETLAKMSETPKRKRRKKEREVDELVLEAGDVIRATEFTSVAELANLMNVDPSEVIQACISLGLMVTINQRLDKDTILMVADEFDYNVKFMTEYGEERVESIEEEEDPALLKPCPPVVTIMGHVDHGKTSLLDHIRKSNIIAGESGGITQHIGAYEVSFNEKKITFLDTPGHKAFTAMRARGAQITDIVVLVIAADDAVMPQTIEAINHARAAGVPILIAINKIDRPNANPDLIKQQLSERKILVEDWGGKVQCAQISAKTGEGIDHLLESILLESELLELKANPQGRSKAVLIEARMDRGRGIVGTVLVEKGTLRIGDSFVAGQFNGRIRAMFDEREQPVEEAPPSTPVQILGFTGMPQAGDILAVVDSEQEAREIGLKRQQLKREQSFRQIRRLTLDQISKRIAEGWVKELSIIIKADVDGSMEAISDSLMEIGTEDVAVRIIHKGVGNITESDVLLAKASQAVIIGFHVTPNPQAKELAQQEQIDIRLYKVIYDIVNDVKLALSGLLEPEITEEIIGTLEIREVFRASRVGLIAGCYVQSGKVSRNNLAHLIRDGQVIFEGKIATLKRFKDDVKEVSSGYECGITLDSFKDIQVGDIVEAYKIVETARSIE